MIAICALILDAIFGEPRTIWDRIPHPAILMGRLVSWLNQRLNSGTHKRAKGIIAVFALVLIGFLIGHSISLLDPIAEILIAASLLAHKSLIQHVACVGDGLRLSPRAGRQAVAQIVGRDTQDLTGPEISRAAVESAAENFSDGVIAPLFWLLVAGLPGIIIYKLINTADSMIGYKTAEFADFGWAAARFDDLLNLAPARLTALVFWVLTPNRAGWSEIAQDARQHRSPNAGWPEAALARKINVALAGPRSYDGQRRPFAWVNPAGNYDIGPPDIDRANIALWQAWFVMLLLISLGMLIC